MFILNANKTFYEKIDVLKNMIKTSKKIVFFGGAGVSTESGIPDFRSEDGLYNDVGCNQYTYSGNDYHNYKPEFLLSHECLYNNPKVFYQFYRDKLNFENIEPNITHKVLAKMEEDGILSSIITQNIDGLHQKAGSKNVHEIHGTTLVNYCTKCKKKYDSDFIFKSTDSIPTCECGGMIRPDVTLYGEGLPQIEWNTSIKEVHEADMLIIGGTSLTVQPASSLLSYYKGDKLVLINKGKTEFDNWADLLFNQKLSTVFNNLNY